jgi:hypothetical protein
MGAVDASFCGGASVTRDRGLPGPRRSKGIGGQELWLPAGGAVIILSLVELIYCYTGQFGSRELYAAQAKAFADRQAALEIPVNPELLKLSDPYDPIQNAPYRINDASLYRGHWYLYFSPVPALLLYLPIELLGGSLTDATALIVLSIIFFVLLAALVKKLLDDDLSYQGGASPSPRLRLAIFGSVIAIGTTSGVLFLLRRPEIYEVAIAAGVVFFLAHCLLFQRALMRPSPSPLLGVAAGTTMALAVGSRINYLPVAAIFLIVMAGKAWLHGGQNRTFLIVLAAAAAPLCVVLTGLGAYNYFRFGSVRENGLTYQVGGLDHASQRALVSNLRLEPFPYVVFHTWVHPPTFLSKFPFIDVNRDFAPDAIRREHGVITAEPQVGALPINPALILGGIAGGVALARSRKDRFDGSGQLRGLRRVLASRTGGRSLFLCYLAASSVLLFLVPSGLYGGWSQRFAAEYLWPATTVAVCALAIFYRSTESSRGKTMAFVVSAASLFIGTITWLLISAGGYVAVPHASEPIVKRLGESTTLLAILGVVLLVLLIAISIASGRVRPEPGAEDKADSLGSIDRSHG